MRINKDGKGFSILKELWDIHIYSINMHAKCILDLDWILIQANQGKWKNIYTWEDWEIKTHTV